MHTSKKLLPAVFPPINGYSHQGALFSMLFAREECLPWVYNNFLQVYSLKDLYKHASRTGTVDFFYNLYGDWKYFYFKANPWIRFSAMPFHDLRLLRTDCVGYLKHCIDSDRYLSFDVDGYYVPAYENYYLQLHEKHEIFIYGYDDEKNCFFMCDNTTFGKCTQNIVLYSDLEISLSHMDEFDEGNKDLFWRERQIYMMKVMKNVEASGNDPLFSKEVFEINLPQILNGIKEYLLDDNYTHGYNFSEFYVFGLDCYDELNKYIAHSMRVNKWLDIRGFYSFYMHKKLMLLRLKYLNDRYSIGKIVLPYETLVSDFHALINTMLKANMRQNVILKANWKLNEGSWLKIIKKIDDLKNREIMLLQELVDCIGNQIPDS